MTNLRKSLQIQHRRYLKIIKDLCKMNNSMDYA